MPRKAKPPGLIVCMPTRGVVTIETMLCLRENLDGYPHELLVELRKPVDIARNDLAKRVVDLDLKSLSFNPEYVLWIDDDAWWPAATLQRAIDLLEAHPEADLLSGIFGIRRPYADTAASPLSSSRAPLKPIDLMGCATGKLIPLSFVGFHWLIMRRSLLTLVGKEPFAQLAAFDGLMTEDYSFCIRAREKGAKLFAERSLLIGHVNASDGLLYQVNRPPLIANGAGFPIFRKGLQKEKLKPRRGYFSKIDGPNAWSQGIQDLTPSESGLAANTEHLEDAV